eukprot:scaffold73673_cov43-Attheya_sp.AAC.1
MARLLVSRSLRRPAHHQVCWLVILLSALLPHLQIAVDSLRTRRGRRKRVINKEQRTRQKRRKRVIFDSFEGDDEGSNDNVYASNRGAFPIEMRRYGPASMEGYETCADMKSDLLMATKFHVNGIIARNAKTAEEPYRFFPAMTLIRPFVEVAETNADAAAAADATADATRSTTAATTREGSFGTNNQEEGVEEADVVQSDGTFVYAAYGDFLVVWRASTGEILQKIQMPPAIVVDDPVVANRASNNGGTRNLLKIMMSSDPPKPKVRALLLEGDRLVVVVTRFDGNMYPFYLSSKSDIISNNGASQVRTYQIKDTGESLLTLLTVNDLQGDYQDARSIGANAHLVTMSNINTWDQLEAPLDRWKFVKGLNDEEYIAAATIEATSLINDFVDRTSSDDDDDVVEQTFSKDGLLRGFLQIHSFDMSKQANDDQTLDMT